ncbi:hypothetical protein Fmac_006217 [Flemingia macrophylla]|uniref:Response regulatory domain-containing protein n=1 Tax=Flemingia macrophylla TaxID=520843 RepID=A0ABD1N9Z0_9FABA
MEGGQGSSKKQKLKGIAEPAATTERVKLGSEFSALVVEKDVIDRIMHKDILTFVGAKNCDTLGNGLEAIALHLTGKRYDLILMDLDLPDDDGYTTIEELRAMGVQSVIISVSGPCRREIFPRLFKYLPIDGHYIKPMTVEMLRQALEKFRA